MSKPNTGFGTKTDETTVSLVENATPLDQLKYVTTRFGDYEPNEMPQLPIGFLIPATDTDPERFANTFTVRDGIDTGYYDKFLGQLEEQAGNNPSPAKIIATVSNFLAKSIEKIGGVPLKTLAQQRSSSEAKLFEDAWVADVTTMILGVRKAVSGIEIAIATKCPCERREDLRDNPEEGRSLHTLADLEIKSFQRITGSPLIEVILPKGIQDSGDLIRYIYIEPLKLYQLGKLLDRKVSAPADIKLFYEMIAKIPESSTYGKIKGRPFCEDLYDKMSRQDRTALQGAIAKIQPGPQMSVGVDCYHCGTNFDFPLPWLRELRYLIYNSSEPIVAD